jgi:hypothetical protein
MHFELSIWDLEALARGIPAHREQMQEDIKRYGEEGSGYAARHLLACDTGLEKLTKALQAAYALPVVHGVVGLSSAFVSSGSQPAVGFALTLPEVEILSGVAGDVMSSHMRQRSRKREETEGEKRAKEAGRALFERFNNVLTHLKHLSITMGLIRFFRQLKKGGYDGQDVEGAKAAA